MKKSILLILILLPLLVSCADRQMQNLLEYQNSAWEVKANFSCNSLECSGTLTTFPDGKLMISYTSPEQLSGISVSTLNGDCEICVSGVSIQANSAALSKMFDIFKLLSIRADAPESCKKQQDGNYLAVFSSDKDTYVVLLDGITGLPRKIEADIGQDQFSLEIISMEHTK